MGGRAFGVADGEAEPSGDASWAPLVEGEAEPRRFTVVGGKGGVGKTSTAAALALRMAEVGRPVGRQIKGERWRRGA